MAAGAGRGKIEVGLDIVSSTDDPVSVAIVAAEVGTWSAAIRIGTVLTGGSLAAVLPLLVLVVEVVAVFGVLGVLAVVSVLELVLGRG